MRIIYQILVYVLQPLLFLRLLYKGLFNPLYLKSIKERYSLYGNSQYDNTHNKSILIHAASVGEVVIAVTIIKKLLKNYNNINITVTTQTNTGRDRIQKENLPIKILFLPYDTVGASKRLLNYLHPNLIIIIETELWLNFINNSYNKKIPIVIANARLSNKSVKNFLKFGNLFKNCINKLTFIAAQDKVNADNYLKLSVNPNNVEIIGNLKYDITQRVNLDIQIQQYKTLLKDKYVWIAASTYKEEDEIILHAFRELLMQYANLYLIIVPRHPERFPIAEELIKKNGLQYNLYSAEQNTEITLKQLLLVDTVGKLDQFYTLANIAFIGGSLIKRGGHNPLEAAICKLPIIVGQHTFNFKEIYNNLTEGIIEIESSAEALMQAIKFLYVNESITKQKGLYNYSIVQNNQGALDKLLNKIDKFL